MAYTPDPTDVTQPVGGVKAGTADDEFRALKAYLKNVILPAITGSASGLGGNPAVRQTVSSGVQNAAGDPAFLVAGVGLALNIAATATPLALTYAAGSLAAGEINYNEVVALDAVGAVATLPASNLSYITKLFGGAWGSTLSPCQYGKSFNQQAQLLFRWAGVNNAVVATEDFGNAVTFTADAKISTATQILGLNTILLDGTGDQVSVPMTNVGADSWEIFGSFRSTSLAVIQVLITADTAANNLGIQLRITTAGKIELFMSSNGTSNDVLPPSGVATIAINTTYYFRLAFDAVSNTYRVYLSVAGAAETVDITFASASRVCNFTKLTIGGRADTTTQGFVGNIGFFGFRAYTSNIAAVVPPAVAPTFADVMQDWYNISTATMYQVTAASAVAGTNPTMTAVTKLYVGEVTTSAGAVVTATSYAFKRQSQGVLQTIPASGTAITATHSLGIPAEYINLSVDVKCVTDDANTLYRKGDTVQSNGLMDNGVAFAQASYKTRLLSGINCAWGSLVLARKSDGARVGTTSTNNFKIALSASARF